MKRIMLLILALGLFNPLASLAGEREQQAWDKIEQGALILDVRTPQEYVGGHLEESLLIPHQEILDTLARLDLPKDREVVLYCRSGNRAGIAQRAMESAGYTRVHNGGGYQDLMRVRH